MQAGRGRIRRRLQGLSSCGGKGQKESTAPLNTPLQVFNKDKQYYALKVEDEKAAVRILKMDVRRGILYRRSIEGLRNTVLYSAEVTADSTKLRNLRAGYCTGIRAYYKFPKYVHGSGDRSEY